MSDFIRSLLATRMLEFNRPLLNYMWFDHQPTRSTGDIVFKDQTVKINEQCLDAVLWAPGKVSLAPQLFRDAISFNFTGCVMARYEDRKHHRWAAHIHMDKDKRMDCKHAWCRYINRQKPIGLQMFRPDTDALFQAASSERSLNVKLLGVITSEGACYSIVIAAPQDNPDGMPQQWSVVKLLQHDAPLLAEGYASILQQEDAQTDLKPVWDAFWKSMSCKVLL